MLGSYKNNLILAITVFITVTIAISMLFSCSESRQANKEKVAIIGMDALDSEFIDPLIKQGKLPHFRTFLDGSARGNIKTIKPVLSPMIWTSVATGKTPPKHGIFHFFGRNPYTGKTAPNTSNKRETKAVWNILSDYNLKSGIVGWPVTFPAEKINGYMVTDRTCILSSDEKNLEPAKTQTGKTYPKDLYDEIKHFIINLDDISDNTIYETFNLEQQMEDQKLKALKVVYAKTETYTRIAEYTLENKDSDFFSIYLAGIDRACHKFIRYTSPKMPRVSEESYKKYNNVINKVYIYYDSVLNRLMSKISDKSTVYLLSDHGFKTEENRPLSAGMETHYADHWHSEKAFLAVSGPNTVSRSIKDFSVYDILPTILYQFGIPIGKDMKGSAKTELFQKSYNKTREIQRKTTHDQGEWKDYVQTDRSKRAKEREIIRDRLESLGYAGGGEKESIYLHLGLYYQKSQNKPKKALEMYRKSLEEYPNDYLTLYHMGNTYEKLDKFSQAMQYYRKAHSIKKTKKVTLKLIDARYKSGPQEKAFELLEKEIKSSPKDPIFYNSKGRYLAKSEKYKKAVKVFKHSLELYPAQLQVTLDLIHTFFRMNRKDKAFRWMEKATKRFKDSFKLHRSLADIYGSHKMYSKAINSLGKALDYAPPENRADLMLRKAKLLRKTGKLRESTSELKNLLQKTNKKDKILYNIGINYRMNDNHQKALSSFRKSLKSNPVFYKAAALIADIHYKQNNKKKALKYINRSLEIKPDQQFARNLKMKIKNMQ